MKKYLIIGASSGIGKALAEELLNQGHQVIGTHNSNRIEYTNSNLESVHFDVMAEELNFDFIPDELDGLIYCPGAIKLLPFKRLKSEDILSDFQLQVAGAVSVIQNCLPALRNGVDPSIVLFSTVAVQSGFNFHTQVSMSKGAIEGLTKALAAELAPTIRVNAIAPGLTDTPLASKLLNTSEKKEANAQKHPMKRIGEPEDLANMAAFLLSEKSSWITGQIIHIDGGMSTLNT
ncbi:MAG: SDR family oxidoreductase [Crocinitomicaceae bacterium]|jgi:NAD(P)-dependent dehydrogenase (short-subunit alcohol dehydrogenase family)|nr:SDR family oxidoreductase [Crocinitomicaceae bacterium]MDC0100236.1 SDR family oxidoreductase [Crocinitomicaceae bacterium]MDC1385328.1 SDR family oxidoreductase [Crocinitomicaceae bacterium]|tara:strand:+ start:862 stop:1560 length:699 start_codon:yes stop_codon:yes gene_type:complete